jgi:hypothetical protein
VSGGACRFSAHGAAVNARTGLRLRGQSAPMHKKKKQQEEETRVMNPRKPAKGVACGDVSAKSPSF